MSSSQESGSHAIKIPLHRHRDHQYATPMQRRRLTRSSRLEQPNGSDSPDAYSPSSPPESSSGSTSRTRNTTLQKTENTIASPSQHTLQTRRHTYQYQVSAQPPRKDKQRATSTTELPPPNSLPKKPIVSSLNHTSTLSSSMLTSSSYKSINLTSYHADPDDPRPARIITYTKQSQGFTWNDELFLPSYLMGRGRYGGGYRRRRMYGGGSGDDDEMDLDDDEMDGVGDFDEDVDACPVADIFVTDEEAAQMLP